MGAPFEPPFGWDEADPHPGLQCHDAHPERAHKIPAAAPRDYDPMRVRTSATELAYDLSAEHGQTLEEAQAAIVSAARVDVRPDREGLGRPRTDRLEVAGEELHTPAFEAPLGAILTPRPDVDDRVVWVLDRLAPVTWDVTVWQRQLGAGSSHGRLDSADRKRLVTAVLELLDSAPP